MYYTRVKLTETQLKDVVRRIVNEGSGVKVDKGSPNQALGKNKTPNTGSFNYGPLHADNDYQNTLEVDGIYDSEPVSFEGPNTTTIPGSSNDKESNIKMKDNFGIKGVKLKRGKKDQNVKIGKHFTKDINKGTIPKSTKQKHSTLNPNRHSNSSRITNVIHKDGLTRGGVVYDSSFKPGKGGDPYTKKTS
tara:strand:+ start:963 stop:1532 length:570 start_codon:yes stop_codon:yes gene_type:complete